MRGSTTFPCQLVKTATPVTAAPPQARIFSTLTDKQRATATGTLILLAYSMLTYTITANKPLGVITDIASGLAVIGIPLLMWPVFRPHKALNIA